MPISTYLLTSGETGRSPRTVAKLYKVHSKRRPIDAQISGEQTQSPPTAMVERLDVE
jgi:hypothetical protein